MSLQSLVFPAPSLIFEGRGGDKVFKNNGEILEDGDGFNFGVFWGYIPENPRKKIGVILGTGITLISGFFGVSSPTNPRKWGWGRG